MYTILSIMFLGIISGYIFKNVNALKNVEKTISITIFALLFILGVSVGSNKMIINNLGEFGSQAFIIALMSLSGSLLSTALIIKLFRKGGNK